MKLWLEVCFQLLQRLPGHAELLNPSLTLTCWPGLSRPCRGGFGLGQKEAKGGRIRW